MNIKLLKTPSKRKDQLLKLLAEGEINVTFIKKDDTLRNMKCTLDRSIIPATVFPNISVQSEKSYTETDTLRVYDLENQGWRAFNVTRVTKASK